MHKDAGQRSVKAFNFYSNLQKNAFDKGFRVSHNPGEGDCMFYALSEQLKFAKEIQHSAAELRQEIVKYLQQNPKLVSNDNDNNNNNNRTNNGNGNSHGNINGNDNDN